MEITDPTLVFFLITIGLVGIGAETLTPGGVFPGLIGLISLTLGIVGAVQIGVSPVGAGLLLVSIALFISAAGQERPRNREEVSLLTLIPAFIISELKTAFIIGFILYVPFLVIDMVVASVLLSMGMMMLPPVMISLPFKLMLFVLVDGWNLVVGSMINSFGVV